MSPHPVRQHLSLLSVVLLLSAVAGISACIWPVLAVLMLALFEVP